MLLGYDWLYYKREDHPNQSVFFQEAQAIIPTLIETKFKDTNECFANEQLFQTSEVVLTLWTIKSNNGGVCQGFMF